jgi:hypothetical protein
MSIWSGRILAGLAATAAVVGAVGASGAIGTWWVPVFALSLVGVAAGSATWVRRSRTADDELSGLAAILDGRTWVGPDVAHPAA